MNTQLGNSFFRSDYMPHGHCYLWQEHILFTHVISDIIIATAYFSIPIGLLVFIRLRPDIVNKSVFILFSLFILCCGITHLMGIWTIWQGVYGLHGITKAATAFVSIATAIYLFRLLPMVREIPSISQYQGVKDSLRQTEMEKTMLFSELQKQSLFQFTLNALPISTLLLEADGTIKLYNKQFRSEFFSKWNVEIPMTIQEILDSDENQLSEEFLPQEKPKSSEKKFLATLLSAQGSVPVEVNLVRESRADQLAIILTLKRVGDIEEIESALVESHARLERTINATQDGIWEWNVKDNTSIWSKRLYQLIGANPLLPANYETWFDHIHPQYKEKVSQAIAEHFKSKKQYRVEYLGKNAEGKYGWFEAIGDTQFDQNGEPLVMSGSLRNVQRIKDIEASEAEKNSFLSAIYNGSNHAIWALEVLSEDEFRFVIYNDTALKHSNTTREQVENKTLTELQDKVFPKELVEKIRTNYRECYQCGAPTFYTEELKLDTSLWFQTGLYPVRSNDGHISHIIGIAVDITEQKQAELKLADKEVFLNNLIDNAVCGLYIYDFKLQRNIEINNRYTDILGYSLDELNAFEDISELFHPSDLSKINEHLNDVIQSHDKGLKTLEYRFKHKLGHWVWCYSADSVVKYDEHGEPLLMLGTFIDVTERIDLLAQVRASNKNLERFAFAASHDLQEPLRKITAFSQSLTERLTIQELDEQSKFELDRLQAASHRMREMINDLLRLSRINSDELTCSSFAVGDLVSELKEELSISIQEAGLEITLTGEGHSIYADPGLIKQVLQNLISNSIKFAKKGLEPIVSIDVSYTDTEVHLIYRDNGIGVARDKCKSIFEPFYRLPNKNHQNGSGIGLAIVHQIIKVHGGHISCEPQSDDGGLCFTIVLKRWKHA
ncbi:PAS domain-containing sensor histidine kinase [Pseudoalteromonas luteoviolacea]|uniref:histidine kinase n=1 Tax=Pseudoalteromonas luteoviolacea S4054 TaxID=1129367 RepID=A0A0F6A720_9GAMM|nr:PAS domain-containing protein [Pseudoalteromonas luteoviolacea]AOT08149.1 hypothetical protein S4054249_09960 [Pseudoalteromonas luteoviolacea]AOT13066.1 hypothetical protein S40542_09960 [Pseudoalteromonas luteoviolacea]AOT17978.1 hypothetical protein S4054_09955 [Pseudoalteromonas luteoviolacea]KKE81651.1 hypothetical protein N479_21760 [Pseudoalteromonas luteoviolacea S4054]KZN69484.1 hypothetical protein N481_22090 [Pseudoalteromonas luteoviolacea S4047-1]